MIHKINGIQTDSCTMEFLDLRTIKIQYADNLTIDLAQMKEDFLVYDEFTEGRKLRKLIVAGTHTDISKEARFFAQNENKKRAKLIYCEAFVLHTRHQVFLGNLYTIFAQPNYPTKVFATEAQARLWMKKF
jgi:hypothetical protein